MEISGVRNFTKLETKNHHLIISNAIPLTCRSMFWHHRPVRQYNRERRIDGSAGRNQVTLDRGLILFYQIAGGQLKELSLNDARSLVGALIGGVLGFGLTFSLYLKSLILIPVSEAVFLHYVAFPFSTILYSTIFKGEKIKTAELVSLTGTGIGVFFIYNVGFSGGLESLFGYLMAFVSGVTYTAALIVLKELGKSKTTLQTLFWPASFGGLSLVPVVLIGGFQFDLTGSSLPALLGLVFISTLLGYSLFARGLKETRAGLSSVILIIVEPFSAVVLAILFLGEKLTLSPCWEEG